MILTISQSWDCLWILSYQLNGWNINPYTGPITGPDPTAVTVYVEPQEWCCVSHWIENWSIISTDEEFYVVKPARKVTIEVVLRSCSKDVACMPRYKNYEALVAKANCLCSNIWVNIVAVNNRFAFLLYDKCLPEIDDPMGVGYHNIMLVFDPNYLLDIIDCICGGKSNPEYITNYMP